MLSSPGGHPWLARQVNGGALPRGANPPGTRNGLLPRGSLGVSFLDLLSLPSSRYLSGYEGYTPLSPVFPNTAAFAAPPLAIGSCVRRSSNRVRRRVGAPDNLPSNTLLQSYPEDSGRQGWAWTVGHHRYLGAATRPALPFARPHNRITLVE